MEGLSAEVSKLRSELASRPSNPRTSPAAPSQSQSSSRTETEALHNPGTTATATVKAAIDAKEKLLSSQLSQQQRAIREEVAHLTRIERELEELRRTEAEGINTLRNQLEHIDKELAWQQKDCQEKEGQYLAAKDRLQKSTAAKAGIQRDLTKMILSSEKKKEAKLNELMAEMTRHNNSKR